MCSGFFFICFLEEVIQRRCLLISASRVNPDKTEYEDVEPKEESSSEPREDEPDSQSVVRTFFVVSALSFHSVIEGFALGLEKTTAGVWINFGAMAMHKFVIGFSLGIELLSAGVSVSRHLVSIGAFSAAPVVGIVAGTVLEAEKSSSTSNGAGFVVGLMIESLQAVATGTVVYVVFFEIFPKARKIGGEQRGFSDVLAMIAGFLVFIPSLIMRE